MHPTEAEKKIFNIPILFMVFNRLEHSKKVFESIKKIAPPRLYIASDGPREQKPGEYQKVNELRRYLTDNIQWECKVETLYRDTNLGCKRAVSEAITWFFEQEEMGIILEDDCVPSQSFYFFCKELLVKYKEDTRIWLISGYNPLDEIFTSNQSYVFTNFGFCWGWASWRRAWKSFDVQMSLWPKAKSENIINSYPFFPSRNKEWEDTFQNRIDTWDYQWYFAIASNSGLSIVPNRNLVRNIGFDQDATHTFFDLQGRGKIPNRELQFPLTHPIFVFHNDNYEKIFLKSITKGPSILYRISNKIRDFLRK